MSAGVFRETFSENPINSAPAVNKFADDREAVEFLRGLAPLHQRAIVKRGMRALDLSGDAPTLDDIIIAAEPTSPPLPSARAPLTGDRLAAWAVQRFLGDPDFTDEHGDFDFVRACQVAEQIVGTAAEERRHEAYMAEFKAHQHAKEIRATWGALAAWLAEYAREIAPHVPDSAICAVPESELTGRAALLADLEKQRIRSERTSLRKFLESATEDGRLQPLTVTERKLMCPQWWRRQLRKRAKRARQFWSAALQTIGGRGGPKYADDYTVNRWQERQEAATQFGSTHEIVGADGTRLPLLDAMRSSTAATLNRLYVMSCGIEEIARRLRLIPVFITITLPAEWHPNPMSGECSWTPEHSPDKADAELAGLWKLFRARLAKVDISTLGMRVFEGHTDGCPHLHALLYVRPDDADQVDTILQDIRPELPRHRQREKRVATKMVLIDTRRARATTYVMKYILKSLNQPVSAALADKRLDEGAKQAIATGVTAPAIDEDEDENGHVENFDRHRAWASERGIRRFALLGVHGMQRIWQRLYTINECPKDAPAHVRRAFDAMKKRRWAAAILALGAIKGGQRGRVRLDYDKVETAYGEIRKKPARMRDGRWKMSLRSQTWTIKKAGEPTETTEAINNEAVTVAVSSPRDPADAGSDAAPDLVYDGRGTIFDPETGEIVDEITPYPLTYEPPGYVPDPDRPENQDFVDADGWAEAA